MSIVVINGGEGSNHNASISESEVAALEDVGVPTKMSVRTFIVVELVGTLEPLPHGERLDLSLLKLLECRPNPV